MVGFSGGYKKQVKNIGRPESESQKPLPCLFECTLVLAAQKQNACENMDCSLSIFQLINETKFNE